MFTTKTLDFLSLNRFTNSREWFNEHKDEYNDYVFEPMASLVGELTETVNSIDSLIVTVPKVDKTISRIFRDMRFCKDGLLFREGMWISFRRNKREFPGYPELFFVMSPNELFYGCGYYCASAQAMETMRELIIKSDPLFLAAKRAYEEQHVLTMSGDRIRKSRYPEADESLRDWLDRKNICFMYNASNIGELFEPSLPEKIKEAFTLMKPVYDFFIYVELLAREKEFRV